jgi:SAM-dependent methyltransferase
MSMLQLARLNQQALGTLERCQTFPPRWANMDELASLADNWVERLRLERERRALRKGGVLRWFEGLDRRVRTKRLAYLDRDDCPDQLKLRLVRTLHYSNVALGSYRRFLRVLRPLIEETRTRKGRPARVLELASGSGEFALALGRLAAKRKLAVEITGSDIVPAHVESAAHHAKARGIPVGFRTLNAFDLQGIEPGEYDIAFIAQSMHHLSPGQLARVIAQATRVSGAFVGVDGHRSVWTLSALGLIGLAGTLSSRRPQFLHDAIVTGRKLYSNAELDLIARIAAPSAHVEVKNARPGLSVIVVRKALELQP